MMKKIVFYAIMVLFALLIGACKEEKKSKYVIGVSQCSEDLWRQTMNDELKREASLSQEPIELIIRSVRDNTEKQIADIDELINRGVDLLIVSPNESKACTPVLKKAYNSGIPVILVDRKIDSDDFTAYVGANNYQIGKEAGLYAAGTLKGKGNILEMRGTRGATSDTERHKGFIDALSAYPDIKIVAELFGNYQKAAATEAMEVALKENFPKVDLVFAMNDPMAEGVHESLMHLSGKMPFIIGIDALQEVGLKNIQHDVEDASFIYPTGGDKVIELALKILKKEPFERENILNTAVIDKSNVRIQQLQTEQIAQKQQRIDAINGQLSESLVRYTNQRSLVYIALIAIGFTTLFFLLSIRAYYLKSKTNEKLAKQNLEIQKQAETLQEQKENLEKISKQLEEATQAKLLFFTNISHEFKTPLSLILGPVDSLIGRRSFSEEERNLLFLIKKNSHRLLHLISEIIEFRSYENGKLKMYFTRGNLKMFLIEMNTFFENSMRQKQISFDFSAEEDTSFEMVFDKEKVEKIYFNLFSNAIKFTPSGGKISISIHKELIDGEAFAVLKVFNTGSYIPEDKLADVFEHFYKVNPHSEGSGIGLALVQALVLSHNGKVSVESSEQQGTTFTVCLPFLQKEIAQNDAYESSYIDAHLDLLPEGAVKSEKLAFTTLNTPKNDSENPTVLIVEDNSDMRKFIKYLLSEEYTVVEAENGEEGFEYAKKFLPDIIISDVLMPLQDGFDLCKLVKSNFSTNHIPVVLLTAYALDTQKQLGFESGADAYIAKPFNASLLKTRVRKLIETRKQIRETFSNFLVNETKGDTLGKMEQDFITAFTACVEKYLSNPELSVDELSDEMGLSRSALYRKIKTLTEYTPNELIRIIRVKYARQLLNTKSKSISEVAYEVGFSSPSYFAKCFKDFYSESPSEYLEKIK